MEELREKFKPEFLNRVDEIIIFRSLNEKQIEKIVDLQLAHIQKRLEEKKITLDVDPAAKKLLAKEGFNPEYGARPLKRVLQSQLLDQLAIRIIEKQVVEGQTVKVVAKKGKIEIE